MNKWIGRTGRAAALVGMALAVLAAAGCSSTDEHSFVDDWTNRPGPWPVELDLRYDFPDRPVGETYRLTLSLHSDPDQPASQIFPVFVGQGGERRSTTLAFSVRPGTYWLIGVLTRGTGEAEVRRVVTSFTMDSSGIVRPRNPQLDI